jgi:O-antigen ligase
MKMVFDRPLFGHGLGMLAVVSPHYVPLTIEEIRTMLATWEEAGVMFAPSIVNAHNAGLDIVAQIGVVGLASICVMYVALFRRLRSFWRQRVETLSRGMVMGGLAFLISDLEVGFFEPACVFGPGSMGFIFVFFVAVILRIGTVRHAALA